MVPAPEAEIPQRFARAEEVLAGKLWREQLREWDETYKPAAIAKHRELQSVDPDALSDEELVAYIARCREHHTAMISQHMRFTASAVIPTGDFLAHVGDWTGLPTAELLGLMRGASPVSAGASEELETLIGAIGDDPDAQAILASEEDPGQVIASLRSLASPAGEAVNAYLDLVGNRLLDGFDISEPSALELPDVLLRSIRTAVAGGGVDATDVEARIADVRARSPPSIRRSSTAFSSRLACSTGSATSAGSTATSGRRGSCAVRCWPAAAGWRRQVASMSPRTFWTRGSTRCAR